MNDSMKKCPRYHCKICNKELVSREERQQIMKKTDIPKELLEYLNEHKLSIHHIDYKRNIAIRVCQECHDKLHTTMKKHQYGLNHVVRKNGTFKGAVYAGKYPDRFID